MILLIRFILTNNSSNSKLNAKARSPKHKYSGGRFMKMKRSVVYGPMLRTMFLISFTLLVGCGGEPELNKITVSPERKTVTIGETIEFKVEPLSKEGEPMPETEAKWSLEPTDRGSIANTGVFTAQRPGDVVVKASAGDISGQARVVIQPKKVAEIKVKADKDKGLPGNRFTVEGDLLAADNSPAGFNIVTLSSATEGVKLSADALEVDEQGAFSFEVTIGSEPGPNKVLLESGQVKKELVLQGTKIVKLAIRPEQK
jgi:hypothetical protein